jgi:Flp pilus assembly protein TadG
MSRSSTERLRCERGQAAVELAMVLPLLLIILLGVIEFGRAFELKHAISGLSREAANLAARGASLQKAIDVTISNGADVKLSTEGGVVASRIVVQDGKVIVDDQLASSGYSGKTKIGLKGAQVGGMDVTGLTTGERLYVVEVFYKYTTITPFKGLTKAVFPEELYERAVF